MVSKKRYNHGQRSQGIIRDNPVTASSPGPVAKPATCGPIKAELGKAPWKALGNIETSKDLLWEFRRFFLKPGAEPPPPKPYGWS